MPFTSHYDPVNRIHEMRVSGLLKRADLAAGEVELAARIDAGEKPLLLVLLNHFGGWQQGDDWDNLDFMFSYGDRIGKIAIVGAGDKQAEVKAFTGAGLRPTPVEFFDSEDAARAWLCE